jgi:hypothetical protein
MEISTWPSTCAQTVAILKKSLQNSKSRVIASGAQPVSEANALAEAKQSLQSHCERSEAIFILNFKYLKIASSLRSFMP